MKSNAAQNLHNLAVGTGFNFQSPAPVITDIRYGSSGTSRRKVDLEDLSANFGKVLKRNAKTTTILVQTGSGYVFPGGVAEAHRRKYINVYNILTIHRNEPVQVFVNDFVSVEEFRLDLTPASQVKAGNKS